MARSRAEIDGRRRPVRIVIAAIVIGLASTALAAPAAQAAPARVWLQLTDPLSTSPVRLQVAAVDSDGYAAPFSGRVVLAVGRTRSTVAVTSATGQEDVEVPTAALRAGAATASATLQVGGKTLQASVKGFIDIPATVELRGFGCGVVTPKQQRVAWQVVRLNGRPVSWPAWTPAGNTFPAYVHTVRPGTITDALDQPIATKGTVVITKGVKRIGVVALPKANRRLLFSVAWPGAMTPGSYTATLTLTDALGRVATASRPIVVATSSAGLCS